MLAESPKFEELAERHVPGYEGVVRRRAGKDLPLCSVVRMPASKKKPAVVETLHFRYDGGVTIRSKLDANTREVLQVEESRLPTPLGPVERDEAIELAREKSERVRKLYEDAGGQPDVNILVPVVSDDKNPKFGHRLVILSVGPKPPADRDAAPPRRVTVEVDLSDGTVSDPI